MLTKQDARLLLSSAMVLMLSWSPISLAQDEGEGFFSEMWEGMNFLGVLRADTAFRTTALQNPNNQTNVPFQDVAVQRQAFAPPTLSTNILNNALSGLGLPTLPQGSQPLNWNIPIPFGDTNRRSDTIPQEDLEFNLTTIRLIGEMNWRFNQEWRLNVRLRALYDPTLYDEFDAGDVSDVQGGIADGGGDRYADIGKVNYYEAKDRTGKNLNPLEIAGDDYMIDLPTIILNYKADNYDLRFGNQQIAWGQAIFFRTFDVANGLDLRRHLVIDRAVEEFEDERVPKIALRGTIQASDALLIDSYIGKFQPDVLGNPNTPYNVVPSQFYKPLDNYHADGYDTKLDYGIRIKTEYGNYGWQAMAVSRYNPLGAFRWAESGITKGLVGGGVLGNIVETSYRLKVPCGENAYNPTTCRLYGSVAEALSHTPFTIGPGGVYNNKEWFSTAASVRLDGLAALNTVIREYPALQDIFASEVNTVEEAGHLLNTFFLGSGDSIRGNVQRDYFREEVFGLGGTYVTETEDPNSFWSQFIVNLEVQYTPERVFTNDDLSNKHLRSDEYIVTLVGEKWYRWTSAFPAAYLVFQYMHRSESDLVGLSLKGYGGNVGNTDPETPDGISSANYLVFAGFQPGPNRKFIGEWAFLLDAEGGLLAQPLIKWNPGSGVSVDLFYNFVDGDLYGDGTSTLQRAIDFTDEIGLRINYEL